MHAHRSTRVVWARVRLRLRPSAAANPSRGAASLISVRDTRDRRPAAADARLLSTTGSSRAAAQPLFGETWVRSMGWHTSDLVGDANKRWVQVPLASINHLCIGSVFSWSMFNGPLTQLHGVVAPAAAGEIRGTCCALPVPLSGSHCIACNRPNTLLLTHVLLHQPPAASRLGPR